MTDEGPGWRNITTTGLVDVSQLLVRIEQLEAENGRLAEQLEGQTAISRAAFEAGLEENERADELEAENARLREENENLLFRRK